MLLEDEIYFRCLEEAEKLIERGYIDMPVEELTLKLVEQLKSSPTFIASLDRDF
jgi:hypothetical protein